MALTRGPGLSVGREGDARRAAADADVRARGAAAEGRRGAGENGRRQAGPAWQRDGSRVGRGSDGIAGLMARALNWAGRLRELGTGPRAG